MSRGGRPGFWQDRHGGIAIMAAAGIPVLALLTCGAIDLAAVGATKSNAQALADNAALQAAKQLGVADISGIAPRTDAFVQAQTATDKEGLVYVVTTDIDAQAGTVRVALDTNRPSFFMNLLPPGGWKIHAEATAAAMARQPLCVLSSGADDKWKITARDEAVLDAPNCLVQSNGDIKVDGAARITAGSVQAAGSANGAISPAAQTGAAEIPDPFVSMAIRPDTKICNPLDVLGVLGVVGVNLDIAPGVHCGNIIIGKDQSVNLLPGEHYFRKGKLELKENASLTGTNVVLVFDKDADFSFKENSRIELEGRKSGTFSGFVIATTRENEHTFDISSDSARKLLGTIYIPRARLLVTGKNSAVADQSAWTVIVAQAIELTGTTKLTINANYAGSSVPVPNGVGPNGASVTLAK